MAGLNAVRVSRRTAVILHDLTVVALAWECAWLARFNFHWPPPEFWWPNLKSLPLIVVTQGLVSWYFGLYRGVWRFASVPDLWNIIRAAFVGALAATLVLFVATRLEGVPRSLIILYPIFLVILLGTPRLAYRVWKDHALSLRQLAAGTRVLVIGAGHAGEGLVRELLRGSDYVPIGFIDDKQRLQRSRIHGVPVLGGVDDLRTLAAGLQPDLIMIAIPSATSGQMQRVVAACEATGLPLRTLPLLREMGSASAALSTLRQVSIEDLLGRSSVALDWPAIGRGLAGRTVLVTGGGGSIGSELCRQLASLGPARLVVVDRSEFNLYEIDRELRGRHPHLAIVASLCDICDAEGMQALFAAERPEVVFHAAAHKHVPMLQGQVREAVRNNVLGTRVVAEAARAAGCRDFVLISTDKAVNPTSIMGMSKRVAELVCEAAGRRGPTRFVTVRFGNVLGSAGSVVPLFREQIAAGGPVTVTHPEVTRYFMTIPEACQLIMQAAVLGAGGEIFVLDMGEPVRIGYLAEQMIRLSGREPGRDIEIRYTGLRPGEKLYEELFHGEEAALPTAHPKIRLARQRSLAPEVFERVLAGMEASAARCDEAGLAALLAEVVPEASPDPVAADSRVVPLRKPGKRD